jgi:winged helix DNA-binding protein
MVERVLSTSELNRSLLARQLLAERSALPLTAALEQVGGLQTQYAPSGYVGLWSRLRDFRRDTLTEALEERRVVQATLMRSTIHLVSAGDYPILAAGLRRSRRDWWIRTRRRDLDGLDFEAAVDRVRPFLAERPRRQAEILAFLAAVGLPRVVWDGLGTWLDLVRVPPSGTWERRRADLYALAETWLGPSPVGEDEGLELLVRRYLAGFGPASLADVASWAGVPAAVLRTAADRLDLRRFRDEAGNELLDVRDAPLPDGRASVPVRFLPTWDANLLVHARRTLVMPERYRPIIFSTKAPQSFPTFLVDGAVAGRWRLAGGRIELDPFEPLPRRAFRELEREAAGLAAFHAVAESGSVSPVAQSAR